MTRNDFRFLLIDHYDSFTHNLVALIRLQGVQVDWVYNDEYRRAESYDALVFSPGPSHPQNAGTSLRYFDEYAGRLPIFGVCLGMQIIAYKLGQTNQAYGVRQAYSIRHGKCDRLKVKKESLLFQGIPQGSTIVRYHSLAINAPQENISAYAQSDGEVMGLELPAQKLYGVQFHPESLLSEHGAEIVCNFIRQIEAGA